MITIEQYSALSARFLDSFEGPELIPGIHEGMDGT